VTTGRGKRAIKLVQRDTQYNASNPLPPIPIATSTCPDTEIGAHKAKYVKIMAARKRKQDAAVEKAAVAIAREKRATTEAAAASDAAAAAATETKKQRNSRDVRAEKRTKSTASKCMTEPPSTSASIAHTSPPKPYHFSSNPSAAACPRSAHADPNSKQHEEEPTRPPPPPPQHPQK
jgi:hypothetical protein